MGEVGGAWSAYVLLSVKGVEGYDMPLGSGQEEKWDKSHFGPNNWPLKNTQSIAN